MKCEKCGAEIREGNVYCNVCGSEIQLVPDYNLLDEDVLGTIIKQESVGVQNKNRNTDSNLIKKKHRRKNSVFLWAGIGAISIGAALFWGYRAIENRHWNSYDYQIQKADAYKKEDDLTSAIACYERALELKAGDDKARESLISVYLASDEDEKAVPLLEELIEENKAGREDVKNLIAIYDKKEEYEKILAVCDTINDGSMLELFADYLVEQPKFNNISGTYGKPLKISISSEQNYDIYYTTDGKDPVSDGKPYREEIALDEEGTTEFSAVARNKKGIYSQTVKAVYTIRFEAPDMPKVTPAGGNYNEPQSITVHVPSDCKAYYTWDGSDPTESSAVYTGNLEMPEGNHVLSVLLVNSSGQKSSIYRVNYIYMP